MNHGTNQLENDWFVDKSNRIHYKQNQVTQRTQHRTPTAIPFPRKFTQQQRQILLLQQLRCLNQIQQLRKQMQLQQIQQ